jgi:hypothetical protein
LDGQISFAQVLFFTRLSVEGSGDPEGESPSEDSWQYLNVAMVQLYSLPDIDLLKCSSQTVFSCTLLPNTIVLPIKHIHSVVAMIPHKLSALSEAESRSFMVEKPGLDVSNLGVKYDGFADENDENGGDIQVE